METVTSFVAFASLALGVILSLRALGVFERTAFSLTSQYLAPTNILGAPTIPHFMVDYQNDGNVEVVFSDFELFVPRLDAVDENGDFIFHTGAKFYIDKRLSAEIGVQQFSKLDHRTNVVRLGARESHIDYFDLEILLPDAWADFEWEDALAYAKEFNPVLRFRDSWGNEYHCDKDGAHVGEYVYPHEDVLMSKVKSRTWPYRLKVTYSGLWRSEQVAHPRTVATSAEAERDE